MPEQTPERPGTLQYSRTRVHTPLDPLVAGSALARWAAGPFVLHERAGAVSFGAGALAEIVLERGEIRFRMGTDRSVVAAGAQPLRQVGELLARVGIRGRRAYGWLAFELAHLMQGRPAAAGPGPLLHLIVPEREVRMTGDGTAELRAVGSGGLAELHAVLDTAVQQPRRIDRTPVDDEVDGAAYREMVAVAVRDIRAGRLQKVILSRVVPVPDGVDLVATYEAGRRGNTPARSFLLDLGGVRAAGFSPETVVEVGADGTVSTQPLAGTRAVSGDPATDRRMRAELLSDPKEVFEHAVSVLTAQAELATLCLLGSVHVTGFMGVSERGSVQHLASRVTGHLAPGRDCWDALAAVFPAVTASGLPKAAACDAIHRLEKGSRGLYSGAVVVADADGGLDAALILRTIYQQDGRTWLRAGAGLVAQSTPEREFEETREKLWSVSRFLVPAAAPDDLSVAGLPAVRGVAVR